MRTWNEYVEHRMLLESQLSDLVARTLATKFGSMFGAPDQFSKYVNDILTRNPQGAAILRQYQMNPNAATQQAVALVTQQLQPQQDWNPHTDPGLGDQSQYGK